MYKKYWIIGICVFILTFILCLIFLLPPKFDLKNGNINLKYGESYREPGFKVTRFGKDYTSNVKVSGKVNDKKVGKYKVIYSVKIGLINFKSVRTVNIFDNEKPVIKLNGYEESYVCPSKKYEEDGFSASDNYDGDLTKKVKVTKKDNEVIYTVTDSSNNKTTVKRKLIFQDKEAPVLELRGSKNITLSLGETFKEFGYTANDNCDGDLQSKVSVSNNIDTSKKGNYEVTYSVTDNAGNTSTAKRSVKIVDKSSLGIIYLTFDDGPRDGTTNVILDILKEEGVSATFFVTNGGPDSLIKREFDEGHTVALHTASHNYSVVYSSVNGYFNDLKLVQDRVKRITGETAMIIRFPGGSSNTVSKKYSLGIMSELTKEVIDKGYRYYDWNVSSGDAGETNASSGVYNNVVRGLSKNRPNVVLMHDIKTYTRDALKSIIEYGKNNGYTFDKITMDTPMVTQRVNN